MWMFIKILTTIKYFKTHQKQTEFKIKKKIAKLHLTFRWTFGIRYVSPSFIWQVAKQWTFPVFVNYANVEIESGHNWAVITLIYYYLCGWQVRL